MDDELDIEQLTDALNESEDGQPDEEPETEEEVEEVEDEETEEEQPEGESDEDPVIAWETASGDKFEVPVSELKQGYMRQQDYTHKSQALAEERRTVHEKVQEQYQQVEQYAQELGALSAQTAYIGQLEAAIGQIDRAQDPAGYNAAVSELLMAQRQRDGMAARITQAQQERTVKQREALATAQRQAFEELTTGPNALPGFTVETIKQLNQAGNDYGITPEELSTLTDPRHIRILHDAMKYRELQAKKPEAVKKAKLAPKRSRQTRSVPPSTIERTLKSFNANPSIESMAALMSAAK